MTSVQDEQGKIQSISIPAIDDFHVHLRQEDLMAGVTPMVAKGGVARAYVMPNLVPPVATVDQALEYRAKLQSIDPSITFLMTLYLSPSLTPNEVEKAAKMGISGIKSYPRGVTTNSDSGIEDYQLYYPVFEAMEKHNLVLNLHGEIPSNSTYGTCILNAEQRFLRHLRQLHQDFPRLRIVLEHVTTADAVEMVRSLGDTVAATITAHHLYLTVDDWAGQPHNFCKPVPKFPHDRDALQKVVREGHPRFFFGSDSAPHYRHRKESGCCPAGVFTSAYLLPYVAELFDRLGCLERLVPFCREFGRAFYKVPEVKGAPLLRLVREPLQIPDEIDIYAQSKKIGTVVPFLAGKTISWRLEGTS